MFINLELFIIFVLLVLGSANVICFTIANERRISLDKTNRHFCSFTVGHAVISAGESGVSFPLKKRDVMLDYVLTLMGRDDSDDDEDFSVSNLELHTQVRKWMNSHCFCFICYVSIEG